MTIAITDGTWIAGLLRMLGLALLAATVSLIISFVYRVRGKASIPDGPTLLVGLGTVALYLNTRLALVQFLGEDPQPLALGNALWNVATFVLAGGGAFVGRHFGESTAASGRVSLSGLQPDLSPIVRATGRFITVTLPDEIKDIEGYDPVPAETKDKLAGSRLDFPKGLTLEELRDQLVARLKEKHYVGYVDLELTAKGEIKHLAVGQRAIGLGPLLSPGSAAVAVPSDPPFSATPGDAVQVWANGENGPERIGRGELRAHTEAVATIAGRRSLVRRVDPNQTYRLVTMPAESTAGREFISLLRRSDETLSVVELTGESPLVGVSIRALDLTVIAVEAADGTVETLPTAARSIQPGDRLHAIGRPESLRKLKATPGAKVVDPQADRS